MAAFNPRTILALNNIIRQLYTRRKLVGKLEFTHDEYIDTFVPQQAREPFRVASHYLADPASRTPRFTLDTKMGQLITLMTVKTKQGITPPYPRDLRVQPDAPPEMIERIDNWAEHGGDTSREFGRVMQVLSLLNDKLTAKGVRFVWPTILALLDEDAGLKGMAKELQDMRSVPSVPVLPRELLSACKQAADTIATVKLIPSDIKENEDYEVRIEIMSGQEYTEPFRTFHGLYS